MLLLVEFAHSSGDSNGKDAYLLELEQQIAETRERKKKEKNGHQDWWEKKNEPRFTVKMPTKPHPSQVII